MKKISTIFSLIALSFCSLAAAGVNVEPTNKELSQYISSLPNDKKEIAEYIIKNDPNYSCFTSKKIQVQVKDLQMVPTYENDYICGLVSKAVFKQNNKIVSINVYGQSFSDNDDIKLPILTDVNGQKINPISVTIKGKGGEKVALPSKNNDGSRALDKGEWIVIINYDEDKFNSLASMDWDNNKSIPIVDDTELSLKVVRSGNSFSLKQRESKIDKLSVVESKDDRKNDIKVFRKLDTNTPYRLETIIEINSYKDQNIVNLGKINPSGFNLVNVSRSVKINEVDGDYVATLNLGHNSIVMQAVSNNKITNFTSPMVGGVENEVWSINTAGKVFDIKGLEGTNSKIAETPAEWRSIPTYIRNGDFQLLEKIENVNNEELPISTELKRTTWFDSNGKTFSFNELNIKNNPSNLQFISQSKEQSQISISGLHLNNEPQVILEEDNLALIPLKNATNMNYSFETIGNSLPGNIWKTNEDITSWSLNLSPRTRLITTTDELFTGSWVDQWNLYTVFFLILLVIAYLKIINYKMAVLVGLSILLFVSLTELIWTWWIVFLVIILSKRVLAYLNKKQTDEVKKAKIQKQMFGLSGLLALVLLVGSYQTYGLIVSEVQYIINPSLELNKYNNYSLVTNNFAGSAPISEIAIMDSEPSSMITVRKAAKSISAPIATIMPQRITEEKIKSYQVGRPVPNWTTISYERKVELKNSLSSLSNKNVKFYIAPVWLVNCIAIIQILAAILLMGLGWLVNYVLLTRNQTVENSKFYTFFFKG